MPESEPPADIGVHAKSRRGKSGNLPLDLTSFVGRRRELADTRQLLSGSRLVTLIGAGGVGKTRLALRIGAVSRRTYDDGVWFVELGELHDGDLLGQAVSGALGLQDHSVRPPMTVLTEQLAEKRILLVLDNCEHLVEAVAGVAQVVLRTCPGVQILATSRASLDIRGEVVVRVPPLSLPELTRSTATLREISRYDAVTLFEQRAGAAVPGFRLTEDNMGTVAEICRRLEGLPLPIELAAARLRAMSVEQIRERLGDRLRLLTLGGRGTPTRQQTLRLCIDWSYDLCSSQEQWLWARLAVFAGGFELDAAEGVLAADPPDGELLDLLTSLIDKSVLIREEVGSVVRYRLLDTIREYGREKLYEADGYWNLRKRHRDWYEQLVLRAKTEWIGPLQVEWIARLEREQPNLRDAMEFCLSEDGEAEAGMRIVTAMYQFWFVRGLFSEGRHWLDRALTSQEGQQPLDRIEALCTSSMLAALQGDVAAGTVSTDQARLLAARVGDADLDALVAFAEGCLAVSNGALRTGIASLENAINIFRPEGDLNQLVPALVWLALAFEMTGDIQRATESYEELIALTESREEIIWRAMALCDYGFAMWQHGERERGTALLEDGLRLSRMVGSQLSYAWALEQFAWTDVEQRPERSTVLLGAADVLFSATGGRAPALTNTATLHEKSRQHARTSLGERAFEAAMKRGAALSADEAVAYALGEETRAEVPATSGEALSLTRREQQVAELVAEGLSNRAIADRLVISQRTVEGHVEHSLVKLGFTSRTQLAAWVHEQKPGR
ncbi:MULTISPECIES: ATP-binding protein [unclassified Rhodococcus (in: high G+C Gram-positive bacteria)]|uniref:ATP-binding protein n=1 Tax=unclassified Rhodococcus (in: high G+C Gram-positive bacteria) TaxID=192944 RepID=UPI00077A9207|nr:MULTISPECIES: LuxR C-terminal-related transcriptional regulator [unclassified Rhodococcus (in: high G+C Gram-positive bacteria)]KXX55988.1 LuxR family transcriptional regulator [Rhodococcus sp. LB1]PBC53558.1 LuxR family transcriptional regulator [Rhodococcus sp. ACPA1]